MTKNNDMTAALPVDAFVLGRTPTATRVHLAECPHLVNRTWHEASESELDRYPLCDWSAKELSGLGRSHPATLSDAMREQGTPAGAVRTIKDLLKFVSYDEIWLPYSKSYVALGHGGRAVASFGKTYVWVGNRRIDLPGHVSGGHEGHTTAAPRGAVCSRCFLEMSLEGTCDNCD